MNSDGRVYMPQNVSQTGDTSNFQFTELEMAVRVAFTLVNLQARARGAVNHAASRVEAGARTLITTPEQERACAMKSPISSLNNLHCARHGMLPQAAVGAVIGTAKIARDLTHESPYVRTAGAVTITVPGMAMNNYSDWRRGDVGSAAVGAMPLAYAIRRWRNLRYPPIVSIGTDAVSAAFHVQPPVETFDDHVARFADRVVDGVRSVGARKARQN
ncbi:MAG: hypothetical protein HY078_03145 [Elusimicrobia bacterium]|nr:hypothetical protein [Elusimicrobiota bacterium]